MKKLAKLANLQPASCPRVSLCVVNGISSTGAIEVGEFVALKGISKGSNGILKGSTGVLAAPVMPYASSLSILNNPTATPGSPPLSIRGGNKVGYTHTGTDSSPMGVHSQYV